ncbi:MAG: cation:proton antiporter [Gemmatimonadetes bacterium]|nr:cation:proton antiporter [Gemmatimonadota bacterium]
MRNNPALAISIALVAGMAAQILARHLRIPGIVVLLVAGAALGPEVTGIVRPQALGAALHIIVGLSVAVILFDGGLNLNIAHLRHEGRVIRRLVTIGAVVTAVGGTLAARLILLWSWPVSILFGTLVIVTGPTVVTPLLRRIRVKRSVHTILEAEGVLIDPIGAIIAVVALEIVLEQTPGFAARELLGLPSRLVVGAIVGFLGGLIIAAALRVERLLPEGLENAFTLAMVLALYEVSDSIQAESGLMAATLAGLVVGNLHSRVSQELRVFKEQLTVLLIGMLFVLLAADVRLAEIVGLGWPGLLVVLILMIVVRPLTVLACTRGTALSWRERGFMAWIGPRGIVAAAVASVFGERMVEAGYPIGAELRALVFLVIACTVVVQGLSGGWVATRLGVRLPTDKGYIVVGANAVGRALGAALQAAGEEVIVIDTNPGDVKAARAMGLHALEGDAFDEDVLLDADIEGRRGLLAVTSNEGANLLVAQRARREYRVPNAYIGLSRIKTVVSPKRARDAGMRLSFGGPVELKRWIAALEGASGGLECYRFDATEEQSLESALPDIADPDCGRLPLVTIHGAFISPADDRSVLRKGDLVVFASLEGHPGMEMAQLEPSRWSRADVRLNVV